MSSTSSLAESLTSSPFGSSIRSQSTTSTELYSQEPFETFILKAQTLCQSIGLGEPVIERMQGGSFNRVAKLTLKSGDQCVLRVPRFGNCSEKTAENVKDQIAINSYVATHLPVPGIIAYDTTVDNAIESPYTIQKFATGQCLEDVLDGDLTTDDRFQIASTVADILVRIERLSFPTPGRLVTAPDIANRCDDFSTISTNVAIAPFMIDEGEVLKSTSCPSVGDFLGAILDMWYEASKIDDIPLLPKWTRLREVKEEMKAKGLLTCEQPVLWHWDFAPRNIIVDRTVDNKWEVTAVLDWDGLLCVPRVLTRNPPVWIWQHGNELDQKSFDNYWTEPRKLSSEEEIIKRHFEDCLKASIDIERYRIDAYDHGPWVRRLFSFAQKAFFNNQDWDRYDEFIKDWEAYCLEDANDTTESPDNDITTAGVGKGNAKVYPSTKSKGRNARGCISWLTSAFTTVFMRRRHKNE